MKEICARNGLDVSDELFHYGVKTFLRAHNWPPGNSQTVLKVYGVDAYVQCGRCNKMFPADQVKKVEFISGLVCGACPSCLAEAKERTTYSRTLEW